MIEVEQKFALEPGDRERLIEGAEFVGQKINRDVYYDTPTAKLVRHETFFRNRDGVFELKVPLHKLTKELPKAYHFNEISDEAEIRNVLGLNIGGSLEDSLRKAGYEKIADIATTRMTYKRGPFTLDFDETDFGFSLLEVERTFEREDERAEAELSIHDFADAMGLEQKHVLGKIHEYLMIKRPDLWEHVKAEWAKWPER